MCKISVIFAYMNVQQPQLDPINTIKAIVRELFERGATMRTMDSFLGVDRLKIAHWATLHDWQCGDKRLFRMKNSDVFDGCGENDPRRAIADCVQQLLQDGLTVEELHHEAGVLPSLTGKVVGLPMLKEMLPKKAANSNLGNILEKQMEMLLVCNTLTEENLRTLERLSEVHYRFQRAHGAAATNIKPKQNGAPSIGCDGQSEAHQSSDGQATAKQAHTNDSRNKAKRRSNDISHVTLELLDEIREAMLFDYQILWYDNKGQRTRFILKSRQVGATFYFAWEALDDAIRTGDDQIFISASRDQAQVFREYITAFARQKFEVELKGKFCLELSNGAKLRFLATNTATAQSYHGHLYIDEVFWIPKFKALKKVADGMAAHKKWRKTYFSTPSAMSHDAFPLWSGSDYAANHKISDFEIDTSHEALKNGLVGPDKIWRHLLTVVDAEAQGCNLFDIDELRGEYSENDFANQFLCKFIDDSQSVFKLNDLMNCVIEGDSWPDYKPNIERPFANRATAFGFDPSRTRDNASLAILEIPANYTKPFRVLSLHSFHGQNVQRQASQIKELVDTHTVRHLGIDTTGIGSGVFDLVRDYYPLATPIHYSPAMKNTLVIKMLDLIANGRFKYLSSQHEITRAFMMITQTTSPSGQIVYASSRSPNAGHADVAWAIAHACLAEEINVNRKQTKVTFSD